MSVDVVYKFVQHVHSSSDDPVLDLGHWPEIMPSWSRIVSMLSRALGFHWASSNFEPVSSPDERDSRDKRSGC